MYIGKERANDLGYVCEVVTDAGDAFGVLEQLLTVELPAGVTACRLYPGPHFQVARLPQVQHLLGVVRAPLHVVRVTAEERVYVDDPHHPLTQLARYALHQRHHLQPHSTVETA